MNSPPPTWAPTITSIVAWLLSPHDLPHAKVGHVSGDHASGKTTFLPRALWCELVDKDPQTHVVHAVPETELLRLRSITHRLDAAQEWHANAVSKREQAKQMEICSFGALVRNIPQMLEAKTQAQITFIVDLELQCPADLALALLAILWLGRYSKGITLLAMSPDQPAYLGTLVRELSPAHGTPRAFSLPRTSPAHEKALWLSVAEEDIVQVVVQAIAEKPEQSHIVVDMTPIAGSDIAAASPSIFWEFLPPVRDIYTIGELLEKEDRLRVKALSAHSKIQIVNFLEVGSWHIRGHIQGFNNVHLIVPLNQRRCVFDHRTSQSCVINTAMSREERLDMLAWAARTDAKTVSIYLAGEGCSLDRYIGLAPAHRRLHVANQQALGFVCSLPMFLPWSDNDEGSVRSFITDARAADEIAHRSVRIGLTAWLPKANGRMALVPQGGLSRDHLNHILPAVHYDTRLAVFLLLEASPNVTWVKMQMAAIITTGVSNLFCFDDDEFDAVSLTEEAIGLTQPLAQTGTIWVLLCWWQHMMTTVVSRPKVLGMLLSESEFDRATITRDYLTVKQHGFSLVGSAARRTWLHFHRLMSIACPTADVSAMPKLAEVLSEAEISTLQKHLMDSFAFHITLSERSEEPAHIFEYASRQYFASNPIVDKTVPWKQMRQRQKSLVGSIIPLGVYCCTPQWHGEPDNVVTIEDWNWIPPKVVNEWVSAEHAINLADTIHSRYPLHPNVDEV
ncbi:hypothetical protein HJFPF1_02374 [Paramyrothecium foliicola]|nr:hypothetical protein HJFPF1_02374 [Paramyrothecium foliicola]